MREVLKTFASLSLFHCNFLKNIQSQKMIHTIINCEFGDNYLYLLNIKIKQEAKKSVFREIYLLYNNWNYIIHRAIQSNKINVKVNFNLRNIKHINISFLHVFKHFYTYNYWFTKVICLLQ